MITAILWSFLAAVPFALNLSSNPAVESGRITGIVTDINGARVVGAKLLIVGKNVQYYATTDQEGAYNISVQTGTYQMQVRSFGFCAARRASFKIESQAIATFDFTLIVCPIINRLIIENGKYKGEYCGPDPPFKEEVFPIKTDSKRTLELMIQYGMREEIKNEIGYKGYKTGIMYSIDGATHSSEKMQGVTITYNLLTVYADEVHFNREDFRFRVRGNVRIKDEKQEMEVSEAEVRLKNGFVDIVAK